MKRLRYLWNAFFDNAVMLKELRMGLRERRIFVVQTIYLILVGLVTLGFLMEVSDASRTDVAQLANTGKQFFAVQFWIQLVMVVLITPGLTCGLLSSEREKKSLDMLLASRLTAREIVLGKLGFAVSTMSLLLFSALPMAGMVFILGGVSPWELLKACFYLGLTSLLAAQVGLAFSAREHRTSHATNQSYGLVVLGLVMLGPVLAALNQVASGSSGFSLTPELVLLVELGYLSALLFLKTVNHLRPQLRNIRWMCLLFLAFYLANLIMLALWLGEIVTPNSQDEGFWTVLALGHLFLMGFFMNVPRFTSPRELEAYHRSLMGRPLVWCCFFSCGLTVLALTYLAGGVSAESVVAGAGLGIAYLFAFTSMARNLATLLGPKAHVPTLYYVLLATTCIVPVFGLATGSGTYSLLSFIYVSPMLTLVSLSTDEPRLAGDIPLGLASTVFYFAV
ncbi:MAG: ABC transporter permease subunit, partial [Candidatus Eremiobacterota bacterium]